MKKTISLAGLLLVTPTLQAEDMGTSLLQESEASPPLLSFVAEAPFTQPRFVFEDGAEHLVSQDQLLVTVELFTMPHPSFNEDPFTLSQKPPEGWQEMELMFKVQNLTTGTTYHNNASHYYALKKGSRLMIYDCDSTKSCDLSHDSYTVAQAVIQGDEFRFTETTEYFYTPFAQWGPEPILDPAIPMIFRAPR